MTAPSDLVTIPEAILRFRVTRYALRRAIARGDLVPYAGRHRGAWARLRVADVEAWMQRRMVTAADRTRPRVRGAHGRFTTSTTSANSVTS